ncbi:hypothetical protein H0H92_009960 [Tricholoma furcatifolium]|nr:hypothetical protein H0H92_009960 [Tricholoma furcatifolium]
MSSATSVRSVKLNTGASIPIIGHGVWCPPEDKEAQSKVSAWVLTAIQNGYRHFDTAQMYMTEGAVGEAIKQSGIPRDQFYITTKLDWHNMDRVAQAFENSLKALGVDYIDMLCPTKLPPRQFATEGITCMSLLKNPDGSTRIREDVNFHQAWAEMEKLVNAGKIKAIGVSNFSIKTMHPYLVQEDLREYCAQKGIILTAYSPSGWERLRNDPVIVELAGKYGVTPNQITLAWHLARDTVLIPKSENAERQKENITLPALSPEDVVKINKLDKGERLCN